MELFPGTRHKSTRQLRNEEIRNQFRNIPEIKTSFDYFTQEDIDDDLPF